MNGSTIPVPVDPPIRRTCRACGTRLVIAVTMDSEPMLIANNDCVECGEDIRPLTPSELRRVEALVTQLREEAANGH